MVTLLLFSPSLPVESSLGHVSQTMSHLCSHPVMTLNFHQSKSVLWEAYKTHAIWFLILSLIWLFIFPHFHHSFHANSIPCFLWTLQTHHLLRALHKTGPSGALPITCTKHTPHTTHMVPHFWLEFCKVLQEGYIGHQARWALGEVY